MLTTFVYSCYLEGRVHQTTMAYDRDQVDLESTFHFVKGYKVNPDGSLGAPTHKVLLSEEVRRGYNIL